MDIRIMNEDERRNALILAHEIIMGESSMDEAAGKSVLDFLSSHLERFVLAGAYNPGLAGLIAYEPDTYRIILLLVKKQERKQGTGKALVSFLAEKAEADNVSRLCVNAAEPAVDFYTSCGFVKTGELTEAGGLRIVPMEYLLMKKYLGKEVTVTIDRPYGSFHPHLPDVQYPLNYGYVDELISEGDFQDAYVYGPETPLEKFRGIVIAIIHHADGGCRFVVGRIGGQFSHDDVIQCVAFEEQHYDTLFVWADEQ